MTYLGDFRQDIARLQVWKDTLTDEAVARWVLNDVNADDPARMIGDIISQVLREYDDPAISEAAARRKSEIDDLRRGLVVAVNNAYAAGERDTLARLAAASR